MDFFSNQTVYMKRLQCTHGNAELAHSQPTFMVHVLQSVYQKEEWPMNILAEQNPSNCKVSWKGFRI